MLINSWNNNLSKYMLNKFNNNNIDKKSIKIDCNN